MPLRRVLQREYLVAPTTRFTCTPTTLGAPFVPDLGADPHTLAFDGRALVVLAPDPVFRRTPPQVLFVADEAACRALNRRLATTRTAA